jgi:hypothetical protein
VSASPPDVAHATYLQSAVGAPLDRADLFVTYVSQLDALLEVPEQAVFEQWESRLWRRGQPLRLLDRDDEEEVVIVGANHDGWLRIVGVDGRERLTTTGELLA